MSRGVPSNWSFVWDGFAASQLQRKGLLLGSAEDPLRAHSGRPRLADGVTCIGTNSNIRDRQAENRV